MSDKPLICYIQVSPCLGIQLPNAGAYAATLSSVSGQTADMLYFRPLDAQVHSFQKVRSATFEIPVPCVTIIKKKKPRMLKVDLCRNMTFSIKSLKGRYNLVDGDEINRKTSLKDIHDPSIVLISRRRAAVSILLAALVGALGFWIGQYALQSNSLIYPRLKEQEVNFQSDRYNFRTFLYNGTFASTSSEETNMAWDSLFPGKLSTR